MEFPFHAAWNAFQKEAKGPLILHISDTATKDYPLAAQLIKEIRPALLLHTGDMADEFKAGRLPEHIPAYQEHVCRLLDLLKISGAEVWIVPGNNDLPDFLRAHCDFPILPEKTFREYAGLSMRLSHYPIENEKEAAFAIYGHNFSSDPNHPADNPKEGVIYLNGVFEWTVIDCATGKYLQFPLKERKPR